MQRESSELASDSNVKKAMELETSLRELSQRLSSPPSSPAILFGGGAGPESSEEDGESGTGAGVSSDGPADTIHSVNDSRATEISVEKKEGKVRRRNTAAWHKLNSYIIELEKRVKEQEDARPTDEGKEEINSLSMIIVCSRISSSQ